VDEGEEIMGDMGTLLSGNENRYNGFGNNELNAINGEEWI
jgi:hypothetical protein